MFLICFCTPPYWPRVTKTDLKLDAMVLYMRCACCALKKFIRIITVTTVQDEKNILYFTRKFMLCSCSVEEVRTSQPDVVLSYLCVLWSRRHSSVCWTQVSLSCLDIGPLVRTDVPFTLSRGWYRFWRPSVSWLLSRGTDITSTAPVSTRYHQYCTWT